LLKVSMETDAWLARWLPLMGDPATSELLELGCDTGRDTRWLAQQGFCRITATDIAAPALQACAQAVPAAALVRHDLRFPLPFADAAFDVVIASLSLHYFDWQTTCAIVDRIRCCLKPGGLLLCRLNSTNDVHHGAVGGDEIEPHYYLVNDVYSSRKRFFDRPAIDALFGADWQRVNVEERTIDRYLHRKVAWELVLRRREGRAPLGRGAQDREGLRDELLGTGSME
jgi:SAM-dependent methyltransferase